MKEQNERDNIDSRENIDIDTTETEGLSQDALPSADVKPKKTRRDSREAIRRVTGIAVFSALAFVVALVCQIIPPVAGFLSLDFKDAVIAMASFIYGPVSAVIIALIAAFIELVTISSTGWYGFVMNFISSAVFSLVASLIYRKLKSINGALIAFFAAILTTTSVMLLMNIFVTPLYMAEIGVPLGSDGVIAMIPRVLLPFNFSKALLNSAGAMILYKPLATGLRHIGFASGDKKAMTFNRGTLITIIVGIISLIVAILILVLIPQTGA